MLKGNIRIKGVQGVSTGTPGVGRTTTTGQFRVAGATGMLSRVLESLARSMGGTTDVVVSLDSAMLQLRENYKHIEIIPQYKMGRYKVDFLMKGDKDKLVVECDSQKWHETSEEHRRYKKERDRFIQASGYKIFRYTGKEIMDRAPLIAVEILHHVSSSDQTINIKMFKEMYKVEEGVDNGKN